MREANRQLAPYYFEMLEIGLEIAIRPISRTLDWPDL